MIYTKMTKLALNLAYQAHMGQMDKCGCPYIFHPYHLAEQMQTEEETCAALLHDVIEDTDMTLDDLRTYGFSENIIEALRYLTHDPDVPYMEYVANIKENSIAKAVKLQDLLHNSDLSRLDEIDDFAQKRNEKYLKAIRFLLDLDDL